VKVFWSWQSDTPGKTGRHFIRDALKAAIDELREPEDVEEPLERDVKDELHLDHDRQGVTGSPRLLETILKKIDASAVFVGDVTPVSTIAAGSHDANAGPEKRIMNPNVAIELGYALKSISELNVLMVLNEHYGGREFLPFDIKGNAGPITYRLAPNASAAERTAEAKTLKAQFVTALDAFVKKFALAAPIKPFNRVPSTQSSAVYFQPGETLARFGEPHDEETYGFGETAGFYLRVLPRAALAQPIIKSALKLAFDRGVRHDTFSNNSDGGGLVVSNTYGAAAVDLRSRTNHSLRSITQTFPNGEQWGFAPWAFEDHGYGRVVPWGGVERAVLRALPRYIAYAAFHGIAPPLTIELGAVGLEGYSLAWNKEPDMNLGPIQDQEWVVSVVLNDASSAAQVTALLKLFRAFVEVTGYQRPSVVNGFPAGG